MITVTGDPLAALLPGIVFSILGLLLAIKPDWYLKFSIWNQKVFTGAKYTPSKKTSTIVRSMGIIFLIAGLFCLYLFFFGNFQ
jgi:uncharacterized membrane protein HdeD (DUF308 family)